MTSPARRHFLRTVAEQSAARAGSSGDSMAGHSAYELMLAALIEDRRRLKAIQSIERKIEVKRELLPAYADWVAGVLAGGRGAQDDVLLTVMVWRLDTGDWAGALDIAAYALQHDLVMPDQYQRTTACVVAEELADQALTALTADQPVSAPSLQRGLDLTAGYDMPDEVRAKLHRALGLTLATNAEHRSTALEHLRRAVHLHDRVGAKKDIERLERELRNATTTGG